MRSRLPVLNFDSSGPYASLRQRQILNNDPSFFAYQAYSLITRKTIMSDASFLTKSGLLKKKKKSGHEARW